MSAVLQLHVAPAVAMLRSWIVEQSINPLAFSRLVGANKASVSLWLSGRNVPSERYQRLIEQQTSGKISLEDWSLPRLRKQELSDGLRGYRFPRTGSTLLEAIRSIDSRSPLEITTEGFMLAQLLLVAKAAGVVCEPQVRCDAGYADLVDDQFAYEVKVESRCFVAGVGQAVLYASSLGRRPCVIIAEAPAAGHRSAAESAGIAVEVFP